tara:strand:- start:993 stop:1334 length:342 start_codon:yes stop_codon:yes gene_type:complete
VPVLILLTKDIQAALAVLGAALLLEPLGELALPHLIMPRAGRETRVRAVLLALRVLLATPALVVLPVQQALLLLDYPKHFPAALRVMAVLRVMVVLVETVVAVVPWVLFLEAL